MASYLCITIILARGARCLGLQFIHASSAERETPERYVILDNTLPSSLVATALHRWEPLPRPLKLLRNLWTSPMLAQPIG